MAEKEEVLEANGAAGGDERRRRKRTPGLGTLTAQALRCLSEIMTDEDGKPADRLNAVKTVLDYAGKLPDAGSDGTLRVVFDGIDRGYAE